MVKKETAALRSFLKTLAREMSVPECTDLFFISFSRMLPLLLFNTSFGEHVSDKDL